MAQKFTVEPIQTVHGSSHVRSESIDVDTDSDEEEASVASMTAEEKKRMERVALKERLAKEFEDSLKQADAADGTGCTMCSS